MTGTSSITREPVADRYLDLLKGCITRLLFIDEEVRPVTHMIGWKDRLYQLALPQLDRREMQVVRRTGDRGRVSRASIGRRRPTPSRWRA